ncbi:MAG: hypothetical protein GY756_17330 [bacterium]|nr:hypothetical protein [bacterium]
MKLKVFAIIILLFSACVHTTSKSNTVYVCENGRTKVYHTNSRCHALKRCGYKVSEISLNTARQRRLRKCRSRGGCK